MGYDYRSYLNQIITLLMNIQSDFAAFVSKFDSFLQTVSAFYDSLLGFLPTAIFFLILLVGISLILKLFYPRWRDV